MREKQVMKSFQNYPFNFFHCAVEMSKISLAWSIMGGSESLCEGVWINFWKHWAKQINVTVGTFSGFLVFSTGDGAVQASIKFSGLVSPTLNMMGHFALLNIFEI